ncbi:MAG: cytochrome c [Pseudomonadales bacterium]|nr:cytochrome c [Pseudomonadales bacterium]
MQQVLTKAMARNIFLGGAAFFLIVYFLLSLDTWRQIPVRDHAQLMTASAKHGKYLMDSNNCIGCHTVNGEGAYFAPELDNVYTRRGPDFIKTWIRIQPTGIAGRRQMPQFNFSDADLQDITAYLQWLSHVNTNHWPPNVQG